jgi:hypothetical protein
MATIIVQDEFDPKLPLVFRWTLGSPDVATEFVLPDRVKKIKVRFEAADGKFTFIGTDDTAIGTHHGSADADIWETIILSTLGSPDSKSVFLASPANATVVQILLEG